MCVLRLFDEQRLDEMGGRLVQPLQFLLGVADVNLRDVEKGLLLVGAEKWRHTGQHHVGKDTDTPTRKGKKKKNEICITFNDNSFHEADLAELLERPGYIHSTHAEKYYTMLYFMQCIK